MDKSFLVTIAKDTPKQLRVEFDKDYFDKITLLKSGQIKDYQNIDVFVMLSYFNSKGFSIIDTFRMLTYLIAQKYPSQDFGERLKDLTKKMPKGKINASKPTDIYSGWIKAYDKGGQNYASLSSFFFSDTKELYREKFDNNDFDALDDFFSSPLDHHVDALEEDMERKSLLDRSRSKTLEDVDVDVLAEILNLSPLGVLASQTNNLHYKAKEMELSSKNGRKTTISEKQQRKEDKIAFIELGVLVYVGYSPKIKERIKKRVTSEKFTGDIEIVFLNR